jgi:ribosomal RNA-processing protein 36
MKKRFDQTDDDSGSEPEQQHNTKAAAAAAGRAHGDGADGASTSGSDSEEPGTSDGGSDDGDDSDAERALEQQLADIPLEVLAKLKQDGLGPVGQAARAAAAAAKSKTFKRDTKNRPQETTSKRPVSRFREVIQVPKQ